MPDSIYASANLQIYKRRRRSAFAVLLTVCVAGFATAVTYSRSLSYVHSAHEDQYGLWMAALKGFKGPVYYVGTDENYSFFRAGRIFYTRYKSLTSKDHLPRTFPFGKGAPYLVTYEMVPEY